MPDAENTAEIPPSEPDPNAGRRTGGDSLGALDVESLEILVNPAAQEGAAPELLVAPATSVRAPAAEGRESPGQSALWLDAVKTLGEQLDRRLETLQMLLEREQRAEAARERVVDRLHAELQEYKQDLLLKVQRPIFIDLIQLHDDIGKLIEAQPADQSEAPRPGAVRPVLESIQTGIEDILYRQGVEPFVHEGHDFDPRKQRAVSTVATDDRALAKTVAARLRKGFQAGDKIIRPEIVTVYAMRPARGVSSAEA